MGTGWCWWGRWWGGLVEGTPGVAVPVLITDAQMCLPGLPFPPAPRIHPGQDPCYLRAVGSVQAHCLMLQCRSELVTWPS